MEAAKVATELNLVEVFAKFMSEGGIFMWIILSIWIFGVLIGMERIKSLLFFDINGNGLMGLIKKHVLLNEVPKAIQVCSSSKALLPQVLASGLKRANQDKEQIQDAMESSMLEVIPQVDKRLNYLSLIANVSTLVGLLGTIYGLIESFSAVALADPANKAKLLALGISKAMNTTAIGLISAISIMVLHSILTSKADKISNDIEQFSTKLLDLLGTKRLINAEVAPPSTDSIKKTA
jgi:biopolymer transport protein ExbB